MSNIDKFLSETVGNGAKDNIRRDYYNFTRNGLEDHVAIEKIALIEGIPADFVASIVEGHSFENHAIEV